MQKFWTYFIVVLTIWPIGMQFGAWRNYFKHELFWDFILKKFIHNKKNPLIFILEQSTRLFDQPSRKWHTVCL